MFVIQAQLNFMKPGLRILITFVFLVVPLIIKAQILKPAKWNIKLSGTNVKAGCEIELVFDATIDDIWYLYANDFDPDCGPIITEVSFEDTTNFRLVGDLKAINAVSKHDEIFDCEVKIFK